MMQKKIMVRQARIEDLKAAIQLEREVWPEQICASEEMYRSRFETFIEGIFVAIEEKIIRGITMTEILDYDLENPVPTWVEATDNGYIKKSHNPQGDTLFGVNLTISPQAPRNAKSILFEAVKTFIIENNFKQIVIGSRIPRFYKYANKMSVNEYVFNATKNSKPLDPELGYCKKDGMRIVKILPNYFEDPESLNFGVLLVWENPFYRGSSPRLRKYLFKTEGQKEHDKIYDRSNLDG